MSTPYTLMRCRMKDLISCFNACKLPIEEDESDHQKAKSTSVCDDRKREREQKVEIGTVPEKGEESPVSWQSCESEEDDYIVFYFKDDAAGGNAIEERVGESSSERKQDVARGGDDRRKKRNEIGKIQVDANSVNESLGELRDALGESSDSSTSSFAFPTVQSEWPGSPVLMPRPEGYKSGGVCIQCCKF
ncbi:hypothetical protein QVD17_10581 [Tagetes erecta]|uniref:Uncharacterized protein n=1 Tax=Tagetes erecta TaxID=13708 RepID=A0AAD8P6B4_TARER|nr:hypothetical protein QVD17_10581 [Tagetes erecta]